MIAPIFFPKEHIHKWVVSSSWPFDKRIAICEGCSSICFGEVVYIPTEERVSENVLKWGTSV